MGRLAPIIRRALAMFCVVPVFCACDICVGTLCSDNDEPLQGELPDGGCFDNDGCANGVWYCGIEITSEEDMAKLEGCTTIGRNLVISGNNVGSLNGLNSIKRIEGFLSIQSTALQSIDGMTSLEEVGGFDFKGNTNLADLSSMEDVRFANGDSGTVLLESNPKMANLDWMAKAGALSWLNIVNNDGLETLLTVDNFEYVSWLVIDGNDGLTEVSGLDNVEELNGIVVSSNPLITDLAGLESLVVVRQIISIENNASINSLFGMSNIQQMGTTASEGTLVISGNPSLQYLDELMSITFMNAEMEIIGNEMLPSCEVKELVDYLEGNTVWTSDGNVEEEDNLSDECSELI